MEVPAGEFQVPEAWAMLNTKGKPIRVWVGSCVRPNKHGNHPSFRANAHAHSYFSDSHEGWTCVRLGQHVIMDDGTMSSTMIHEWAHHLVPNAWHSLAWAKKAAELGNEKTAHACSVAYTKWARKQQETKAVGTTKTKIERQALPPGTKLEGTYKGKTYYAEITASGDVWFDGSYYSSLSRAVQRGIGYQVNGWRFWKAVAE